MKLIKTYQIDKEDGLDWTQLSRAITMLKNVTREHYTLEEGGMVGKEERKVSEALVNPLIPGNRPVTLEQVKAATDLVLQLSADCDKVIASITKTDEATLSYIAVLKAKSAHGKLVATRYLERFKKLT